MVDRLKEAYENGKSVFKGYGVTIDCNLKAPKTALEPFMVIAGRMHLVKMFGSDARGNKMECYLRDTIEAAKEAADVNRVIRKIGEDKRLRFNMVEVHEYDGAHFVTNVHPYSVDDEGVETDPPMCLTPLSCGTKPIGFENYALFIYTGEYDFKYGDKINVKDYYSDQFKYVCKPWTETAWMNQDFVQFLLDNRDKELTYLEGGCTEDEDSYIVWSVEPVTARNIGAMAQNKLNSYIGGAVDYYRGLNKKYEFRIRSIVGRPINETRRELYLAVSSLMYNILGGDIKTTVDLDEENKIVNIVWWIE